MKKIKVAKKLSGKGYKLRRRNAKTIIKKSRPIHRRFLLHPITVFLWLCVGVLIIMQTMKSDAAQLTVKARLPAPPLQTGATIYSPVNNAIVNQTNITVKGSCPASSYVTLMRNNLPSGVALCAGGYYQIGTTLLPNGNKLKVQAYNITDDPGPETPEVFVIYDRYYKAASPSVAASADLLATYQNANISYDIHDYPILTSLYNYGARAVNEKFELNVDILGGMEPYKLSIDWGDGVKEEIAVTHEQKVDLSHKYSSRGKYAIFVNLKDNIGMTALLQHVAVIVPNTYGSVLAGNTTSGSPLAKINKNWLPIAWGSYLTVGVMAMSFWLGERQMVSELVEYKKLTSRLERKQAKYNKPALRRSHS